MNPSPELIQRLQALKARAQRMLMPGSKTASGNQPATRLTPLLDEFSAQKYKRISLAMRSLNRARLGSLQPERATSIVAQISRKFANKQALLRLQSAAGASIWSELEQPLPTASPERATPEENPGTLRQGSIIPKMAMVPKPGQSLESFKKQVQSRVSAQPAVKPAAPAPAATQPNAPRRRYTQIEEITKKERAPGASEPPAASPANLQRQLDPPAQQDSPGDSEPSAAPPANLQRQLNLPTQQDAPGDSEPPTAPPANLQRQPDSPTPLPAQTTDTSQERTTPLPAPVSPATSKSSTPPAARAAPPKQPTPQPPSDAPAPTQPVTLPIALPAPSANAFLAQARASLRPSLPALPRPKTTPSTEKLPRALPSRAKPTSPTRESLPKALPTVRRELLTPSDERRPAASTPQRAILSQPAISATPAIIQRQEEPSPISPRIASTNVTTQPPTTTQDAPAPVAKSEPFPQATPLLTHITQRKTAAQQVRFIEPKNIVSQSQRPTRIRPVLRQPAPLPPPTPIAPGSPPADAPMPHAPMLALLTPAAPHPRPSAPVTQAFQARTYPRAPIHAEEMPLLRKTATPAALGSTPPPTTPETPSPRTAAVIAPGSAPGNTIQRRWDGHTPPSSSQEAATENPENTSPLDLDLNKLAEDVLPIVKRLIEIETERSSGYIR